MASSKNTCHLKKHTHPQKGLCSVRDADSSLLIVGHPCTYGLLFSDAAREEDKKTEEILTIQTARGVVESKTDAEVHSQEFGTSFFCQTGGRFSVAILAREPL